MRKAEMARTIARLLLLRVFVVRDWPLIGMGETRYESSY
jgi:hypothetical protein